MKSQEPLLTTHDVARLLSMSEAHIRRLVQNKRIPSVKIGGCRRFIYKDIMDWIESQRDSTPPDQAKRKKHLTFHEASRPVKTEENAS